MLTAIAAAAFVAYPLVVFFGFSSWGTRTGALLMLALFGPLALWRMTALRRSDLTTVAIVPLVTVMLLSVSALLNDSGFALAVPVAVNLLLLISFAATLRFGPPMIERFARLQDPHLDPPRVAWCRLWTQIWCLFFLINGSTAALTIGLDDLRAWTLYNGLIAYILIGLLFAVEFVLRRLRFGSGSTGPDEEFP